jgi:hypothetical protein
MVACDSDSEHCRLVDEVRIELLAPELTLRSGVRSGSRHPIVTFPGWRNYLVDRFSIQARRPGQALTSHFSPPRGVDFGCQSVLGTSRVFKE